MLRVGLQIEFLEDLAARLLSESTAHFGIIYQPTDRLS